MHAQTDVVHLYRGAVVRGRSERDLELARQEREFRVQREMLAQQLGPHARLFDLIGRDAGPLIGGDVAHAIAAGLHPVQSGAREVGHRVGQFGELDPVELDVLAGGEMAVAAVVAARDMGERAQLRGRERAVRDRDPQHIGMQLQIDAVHQAQRLEFLFRQFAGKTPPHLVAEFAHALGDKRTVEVVVDIHRRPQLAPGNATVGPLQRMRSRRLPGSTRCPGLTVTGAT